MTEPESLIADLDAALAEAGEDVVLQRLTGTQQIPFSVTCRAVVRGYTPEELVAGSGIVQGDSKVILSPTEIERAQWPGAQPQSTGDKRVPRVKDVLIVQGKPRNVMAAMPFYVAGELVRIELQVRGS